MLITPFLTDLDSRAAVKGSRDALGLLASWTRLGRHVVGNLTMASSSLRDFTVTLLGHHFAEQLSDEQGTGAGLETFLKWEQLAAYSRAYFNHDYGFRGTDRVRRQLNESPKVTISADRAHQILGNQKIYGLWALYTGPSRTSGLLESAPLRLTPPARELTERHYLPILEAGGAGRHGKRILELLRKPASTLDLAGRDSALGAAVAKAIAPKLSSVERSFYLRHLVDGGDADETQGLQPRLADLIDETLGRDDFIWSPPAVGHLVKRALRQGNGWDSLAHRLDRIRSAETVFAPSALLLTYLLGLEGSSLSKVSQRLRDQWGNGFPSVDLEGFEALRTEIGKDSASVASRWIEIARSLKEGDYEQLVRGLVDQNQHVMKDRGGLAWIEIANKKLVVRFRDEQGVLPTKTSLPTLWRFPYFLDALRQISRACGGTGRKLA